MSCDSKRRKFLRGLAPSLPQWAAAVGLDDPARCARWLERVYQVSANRGRNWETSHPAEKRIQSEKTTMAYVASAAEEMREEIKQAGIQLHNHGDGRSSGADWGYAQLRWTMQAMQGRQNLPPVAADAYLEELSDYINSANPLKDVPLSSEAVSTDKPTIGDSKSTGAKQTGTFIEVLTPTGDSFHPSQLGNCSRCGRFYNTLDPATHLCPDLADELGEEDELEEALVVGSDGYAYSLAQCERCPRCGGLFLWRDGHECPGEQLSLPLEVEPVVAAEQEDTVAVLPSANTDQPRTVYYFAFGSNMNPQRLKNRHVRFSRRLLGQIKGWDLQFNKKGGADGVGFANVMPTGDAAPVEGALYEMPLSAIEELSRYEGYPHHYGLQAAMVDIGNGQAVPAVMYVAQPWQVSDGLKPTKDYLDHLIAGKDLLSAEYVERLATQPVAQTSTLRPKKLSDWPPTSTSRDAKPKKAKTDQQPTHSNGKANTPQRQRRSHSTYGRASSPNHLAMAAPQAGIEQALEMLHEDLPADRWEAVRSLEYLAARGGKKAFGADLVRHTVQAVADSDWNVRAAAQRLYDRLVQDPEVCRQLIRAYNNPNPRRRLAVVAAIRSAKDRPDVRKLLSAALTDPDDEVAAMADYVFWHPIDGSDHPRVAPPGWDQQLAQIRAADGRVDYRQNLPFLLYGTLRRGEGNYHNLLRGQTLLERPAQMENQAMYTPGLAFVVDSPYDHIVGDMMWVTDDDFLRVARSLDRLEGFDPARPDNAWGYRRVARPVLSHNGAGQPYLTRAWVYQGVSDAGGNRSWTAKTFRPTGDWLDRFEGGSSDFDERWRR